MDQTAAPPLPSAEGASPAMAQWFACKAQHPDALLFFRMGDFFELFFADAEAASGALDIALTYRGEHQGQRIAMCGVPVHSHEGYLARLIRRGFRVAIAEQMETPEEAKRRKASAVRREVVRLVTPGTITEDSLLEAARPAWLLSLAPDAERLGAAWLDISTGAFETEVLAAEDLPALLARLEPAEILAPPALGLAGAVATAPPRDAARRVAEAYHVATLDGFGEYHPAEIAAAAMAIDYLRATQKDAFPHLSRPVPRGGQGVLQMDAATRRSLEILRAERGGTQDCLLGAVDRTVTAAGTRALAARLGAPLAEVEPIAARHDAVAALLAATPLRAAIRARLKGAPDVARALARLSLDRFAPRDLAAVRDGLARAAAIAEALEHPGGLAAIPPLLAAAGRALRPSPDPGAELARALAESLPARLDDPGIIAPGYDGELDALRRLRDDARGAIAALQLDLAQAWGVAALKVRHHQQFGYLAELPAAAGEKLLREAPATATGAFAPIHRQTMANGHRFTCAALADLDRRLSEAADQAARREKRITRHLRELCLAAAPGLTAAAEALAEIDLHAAAAELAAEGGWCRPELTERPEFCITGGRHPVVAAALARNRAGAFVPNDCDLSPGRRICLLTGPNMAGKSTFLRQNALFAVLAQAGFYLPAEAARLGLVDRLFSRVGAADDIAGGRSTFMVEMAETAAILNLAGPRSLVVLDEVGRGTATWDGLAVAWAVLEALHDRTRCRTIFATHFHELTALAGKLPELTLATMRVKEWKGEVVFQHSVGPGAAERSWGLHVARLAGVPRVVLARAAQVLEALEARARGLDPLSEELPLFARPPAGPAAPTDPVPQHPALEALAAIDPDTVSPREAQQTLYRLQALLNGAVNNR
ncbi:DNA mismatch repair protein MutS [Siccirubricoccus deserti]|uniref:DNA mismatch repair protein MutS n=1 Tax=Siccirubricoccus deserti TaxID=2013562 RepID=A0A9X0QVK5_9PROT|nr:DNA mismatch repair protein MutS [Siccirubricoccus deserti]MBC4014250.1 DNA mismatch repair protein MutS [Siccirubricoccus deserti]GGC27808.1 DNA mismatch repair protein MutS [Siccirubricoccus deserti]